MRYHTAMLLWSAVCTAVLVAYWQWGIADSIVGALAALGTAAALGGAATAVTIR